LGKWELGNTLGVNLLEAYLTLLQKMVSPLDRQ
jgi:hypothetical protein